MRFIYICLSILVDVDITIHEKQTHTIIINDNSGKRAERKRKKGNKRMKISTTELVSSGYSVLIKRINQCFSVLIIMLKVFFFTLKRNGTIAETLGTWLNIPNDLFFFLLLQFRCQKAVGSWFCWCSLESEKKNCSS